LPQAWIDCIKQSRIKHAEEKSGAPTTTADNKPTAAGDLDKIYKGSRHNSLMTSAGRLRQAKMTPKHIYYELLDIDNRCCVPPLQSESNGRGEIARIAGYVASKTPAPLIPHSDPMKDFASTEPRVRMSATDLDKKTFPPRVHYVENLLTRGTIMLAAAPKIGKSWLALDLCLSVALGRTFLGRRTTQAGTLYMALEDEEDAIQERMRMLLDGYPAPENCYIELKAPPVGRGFEEYLDSWLKEKPCVKLVVVDVMARIRDDDPKVEYTRDYQLIATLRDLAQKYELCLVVVHHTRKMPDAHDSMMTMNGSTGIIGAGDTNIVLHRGDRFEKRTKFDMTSRLVPDLQLIIEREVDFTGRWQLIGTAADVKAEDAATSYGVDPLIITIRALIAANPCGFKMTCTELARELQARTGENEPPVAVAKRLSKAKSELEERDRITVNRVRSNGVSCWKFSKAADEKSVYMFT
jgi:hypothetical protein